MNNNHNAIKGLGNDIIEVDRIRQAIDRHGSPIIEKIFTVKERDYCLKYSNPPERFAGRFAAKEAVSKALGTGIGNHISWHDIEIINDKNGKPILILSDNIKIKFKNPKIVISLSHTSTYATAVAIWY